MKQVGLPLYPDATASLQGLLCDQPAGLVDVMLVNPPSPDGGIWIRSQHRVGRRSREGMVWPQCSLAQLAAMLSPDYSVKVVDAIAERMSWAQFESLLKTNRPKYYLTQVTAPTLANDMYGVMLAKSMGAKTIAFGTHVTPIPINMLRDYPALDFVIYGEPELTFRELVDVCEGRPHGTPEWVGALFRKADRAWTEADDGSPGTDGIPDLSAVKGLAWRNGGNYRVNPARPFIAELDDLPLPLHHLLPVERYAMPLLKGTFSFVVTSRGCPAGCTFCIKHVTYQNSVRLVSPDRIMQELVILRDLGVRNIHMYADLFTVNREQVMALCEKMIAADLGLRWTCNSRVDYVDQEMLALMARAGCWMISWGIEGANETVLRKAHKGVSPEKAPRALQWSRRSGIKNWGYFIIGLPGETEATIRQTIDLAKRLPLDIALFHVAAPHPGTPFFFEVVKNGWFKPGARWEEVDMDKSTVLQYGNLSSEDLLAWQKRAFREWALRPGPAYTYLKMLFGNFSTFRRAVSIGLEHLVWIARKA